MEEPVVVHTRESVGDGLLLERVEEMGVRDRRSGLLGERRGELDLGRRELALAAGLKETPSLPAERRRRRSVPRSA